MMAGVIPENGQPVGGGGFGAPVARELVHRRSISEVFLTDIRPSGGTGYTLSAQWPRWHVFFDSRSPGFDSALVVETLRQLTVLIAHTQLGVPVGARFLMPEMFVSMAPNTVSDPGKPAEVRIEVRVSDVRQTVKGTVFFRTTANFLVDGVRIAGGTAGARIVDPGVYDRFRSGGEAIHGAAGAPAPAAVSSARVGHGSSLNVVLGRNTGTPRWPLRVDVSNPVLFDHPLDHVPGVVLIEAVRQAFRLARMDPTLDFAFFDARFMSMVELGSETEVVLETPAEGTGDGRAVASIQTLGEVKMRTIVQLRPRR